MANDRMFLACKHCQKEAEDGDWESWAFYIGKHFCKEWYGIPESGKIKSFFNEHFFCGTGSLGQSVQIQYEDTVMAIWKKEDK